MTQEHNLRKLDTRAFLTR